MSDATPSYSTRVPRPDPAQDMVGYLRWLGDRLEALDTKLGAIRMDATEAARTLGYKPGFFYGKPWRIPGFARLGYKHTLAEWEAWIAIPDRERKLQWESLPVDVRKSIRGAA